MQFAKTLFTAPWFFQMLLVIGTLSRVESLSSSPKTNRNSNSPLQEDTVSSRRQLFQRSAAAAAVASASLFPSDANAACLQGDLRPVCIGFYKVPLDDNILPYISTPEQLNKFAPDLTYVPPIEYPKSFESAMSILKTQRALSDEIRQHVMAGKLEEAGVQVLGLLPQVSISCKRIVAELETTIRTNGITGKTNRAVASESEMTVESMAIEMAEDQSAYVNGYWGDCDITIGQGIRGELGVLTVAQLTILASLRDATGALDDFLVTASTLSKNAKVA